MFSAKIKEFMDYFCFLQEIVKRDFKKKYYKSVLGVLWSMLNPLLTMIVITIVFSTLFKKQIPFYPAYWFSGNMLFTFILDGAQASMNSMLVNSSFVKKMKVPKYIFCISSVTLHFIIMLFSTIPFILVALCIGVQLSPYILLIPVPMIYAYIFTLGLGMFLCAYGTSLRDLNHLYGVIKRIWMYFTPLFYPIDIVPAQFRFIWELNPIYIFVSIFRDLAIYGVMPSEKMLIIATFYSLLTLILGIVTFREKEDKFFLYI
ncbi:MAG: ABC transporter permease [Acutalibacteraceae bacterium]